MQRILKFIPIALVSMTALFAAKAHGSSLTVGEAYRLIPHQQTVFQPSTAQMPASERDYLVALFQVIDRAIVAKVSSSRRDSTVAAAYAPVWKAWADLRPPAALRATQDRVKSAIEDQQAFLLELESKKTVWNMRHPKVGSASGKLQQAYSELMNRFPRENATNKQAFFDYLCALDFI